MQAIEQQLSKLDLLMNPKEAMQNFTVSDLQAVQDAVAAKLSQFDAKGFTGQKLVEKLQFEVNWVEQNKKYPTWQVAQQAYNKQLADVQKDIALKALLRFIIASAMATVQMVSSVKSHCGVNNSKSMLFVRLNSKREPAI